MNSNERISKTLFSLGYAAPEIFKRKPFDGIKADIFSLGVILFKIVTNKSIFFDTEKFNPGKNKQFRKYIDEDIFYSKIKDGKNDDFWKVVIGEELNLDEKFKNLVINMIAYNPEERKPLNIIENHSWLEEVNHLTDEERVKLDDEVEKELKEILNI